MQKILAAVKVYEKAKNFKTEPSGKKIKIEIKKRASFYENPLS